MAKLPPKTMQEIEDLLKPVVGHTPQERRALLLLALGDSPVIDRIEYGGKIWVFIPNLIEGLVDYSEIETGKQALWALLEYVHGQVGVDKQRRIDALRSEIEALSFPPSPEPVSPKPKPPPVETATPKPDHGISVTEFSPSTSGSLPPYPSSQNKYNSSTIRRLLTAAFSDEEFTNFCYDNFRAVFQKFAVGMIFSSKVQLLIEYCDRNNSFDQLLLLVCGFNPAKCEELDLDVPHPDTTKPPSAPGSDLNKETQIIQVTASSPIVLEGKTTTERSYTDAVCSYLDSMKAVPPHNPQFYLASCLVSNQLYYYFVCENKYWYPLEGECKRQGDVDHFYLKHWTNGQLGDEDHDLPVTNISFRAARAFAKWLSKLADQDIRLPILKEWQTAVQAGRTNWVEEEILAGRVNYHRTSGNLRAVDAYLANPFGIHDLLGNAYDMVVSLDDYLTERLLLVGGCYRSSTLKLKDQKSIVSEITCLPDASFRCVRAI